MNSTPFRTLIVIPAYNEEASIGPTLLTLTSLDESYEIVVVNDGSRDKTTHEVRKFQQSHRQPAVHLVELPRNRGIGAAVQTGYLFAAERGGYEYVIQFDGDGQHDATAIPRLVAACQEKNLDLCVGSRFLEGGHDNWRSTLTRRIGIRFFAALISFLSGIKVTDPTSGFRCAGPRAWRAFADRYPDDYPEPEALYWCARNNLTIGEIPVTMYSRTAGESSIKLGRGVYYMFKVTLAILIDRIRKREKHQR